MSRKSHKFNPDWVVRPGEVLREEMELQNLSPRIVARLCGVTPEVIEGVLDGSQRITEQIAAGLSSFGVSKQFWLNFERIYRDGLAAGKKDISA